MEYTITYTDRTTSTFYVTNGAKGEKGDTGATPNLQIGTVETLASGSSATASITGTTENPLLNLGIPRGADGASGTGGSSEWELLHTIEITEETTYIDQDINPTKENILIIYEDVWANNTSIAISISIAINGKNCNSVSSTATEGSFINNDKYKSNGFILIEKIAVGFMVQFAGKNGAGNSNASSAPSAHYINLTNSNNLDIVNHIMISLNSYNTNHFMGGTFKIYGK